jgi:hypothetical protein
MRYAIYWCPEPDTDLGAATAAWLGRSIDGTLQPQPRLNGIGPDRFAAWTEAPRRYGPHATLKPPMRLAEGCSKTMLLAAVHELASRLSPVSLSLGVAAEEGFCALRPQGNVDDLTALAGEVVMGLDRFRRAPTEAELSRRHARGLDPRQSELLQRWGYPYVLDRFHFHVTLSQSLAGAEMEALAEAARSWFQPVLALPLAVQALSVLVEPEPGAPFTRLVSCALGR